MAPHRDPREPDPAGPESASIVFVPIAAIDAAESRIHALRCVRASSPAHQPCGQGRATPPDDGAWDRSGLRHALQAVSVLPFDLDFVFPVGSDPENTTAVIRDLSAPRLPHAIRLNRVILEIPAVHDLPADAVEDLERLRSGCMRLSLAGDPNLCSHTALLRLRPDYLTLHQTFVDGISSDADRQMVAESIAQLAWKLGTRVIAEGIRTAADVETLRGMGISLATGALFRGPLLLTDLAEWRPRVAEMAQGES